MTRASVIVPARDAAATIGRTLECLTRQEAPFEFETIVVDDGSSDGTRDVVRTSALAPRLLEQQRVGAAEARNLGAREAEGELLAFLDADCFPAPGWLAAGARALDQADIVQGRVEPDPEAELGPFDRTLWVGDQDGLWQTANLFVTRELFERIGGFEDWLDVEVGKLMAEDVWLGWRATRAGGRPAFSEEALAHHAVFRRGWRGYVEERRRARYFPAIVAKIPELRGTMLFGRLFLSPRTAAFDAALGGLLLATGRRALLPLLACVPYARLIWSQRLRHRGARGRIAAAELAADAVTAAELARGSVRYGRPVL